MKFVALIPARWASSRFPGKPLVELDGVPMVVRTAHRALLAKTVTRVVVATEDARIVEVCKQYHIESVLTGADHQTGTDRIAEASRVLGVTDIVNVQGDEPLIDPDCIDALVEGVMQDDDVLVSNGACSLLDADLESPNVVKAVCDQNKRLMFLSRLPIPYAWNNRIPRLRHLGLYAFKADALNRFVMRAQGPIERAERVEMYRFLEYGDAIRLVEVPSAPPAVDVPEDVEKINAYVEANGGWAHYSVDRI